jgi:putative transposase
LSKRKQVYQTLFQKRIPELSLTETRDATNKSWVLGNNCFKQQIERRASPLPRGGDKNQRHIKILLMLNNSDHINSSIDS